MCRASRNDNYADEWNKMKNGKKENEKNKKKKEKNFANWKSVNYMEMSQLTSIIFLFVRDSWGSLYSVYLRRTLSISVLAYWYNLLLELNIIRAISQSHNTDNSYAFFMTPNFLLLNVTYIFELRKFIKHHL